MQVRSRTGVRTVPADQFFKGYFATALEPGELLTSIEVPPLGEGEGAGYVSLSVAADAKAIVRAAAWVRVEEAVRDARVVLAHVLNVPVRDGAVESALVGSSLEPEAIRAATAIAADSLDPVSDFHADPEYRRKMAKVVAHRAVVQAVDAARQGARAGEQGSRR